MKLGSQGKRKLGSQGKRKPGSQGKEAARVWAKKKLETRKNPGVTSHTLESIRKCEGVNPHTPKAIPTLGDGVPVDSQNFRERFQGSKLNGLWVFYIIRKLLDCRCLKLARIAHLDIWNTNYDQKKGRESNCHFDSRPQKVRNRPDLLGLHGHATYHWKALDKS